VPSNPRVREEKKKRRGEILILRLRSTLTRLAAFLCGAGPEMGRRKRESSVSPVCSTLRPNASYGKGEKKKGEKGKEEGRGGSALGGWYLYVLLLLSHACPAEFGEGKGRGGGRGEKGKRGAVAVVKDLLVPSLLRSLVSTNWSFVGRWEGEREKKRKKGEKEPFRRASAVLPSHDDLTTATQPDSVERIKKRREGKKEGRASVTRMTAGHAWLCQLSLPNRSLNERKRRERGKKSRRIE